MAWIDYAIPILVVGGLVLAIIAKATNETLGEILSDIKDFFVEKKEDVSDNTIGVYD